VDLKRFDDEKLMMVGLNTSANNSPSTIELICVAAATAREAVTYAYGGSFELWTLDGRGMLLRLHLSKFI
jgi:hypothetical protein